MSLSTTELPDWPLADEYLDMKRAIQAARPGHIVPTVDLAARKDEAERELLRRGIEPPVSKNQSQLKPKSTCTSCSKPISNISFMCTKCPQYLAPFFCLGCVDAYQLILAHQSVHGGDHQFRRVALCRLDWNCNRCGHAVDWASSFTCLSCPYQNSFDLCWSCAKAQTRSLKYPEHHHVDDLAVVAMGVILLDNLHRLKLQFGQIQSRSYVCGVCRWQIFGLVYQCQGRKCDFILCSECVERGQAIRHGRTKPDHNFKTVDANYIEITITIPPRNRLSNSNPDLVSELQARYSRLRMSRNSAVVGCFASIGFSLHTQGGSLFGLLFSGPKFCCYQWKLTKLKKEMKGKNVELPDRRVVEIVAPLVFGAVLGGFGLGVEGIAASHADAAVNVVGSVKVGADQFLNGAGHGAVDAVTDFVNGLTAPPSEVFIQALHHSSEVFNPGHLATPDAVMNHLNNGATHLHHWADAITHGTVLNEHYGKEIGEGIAGTYLGEKAGDVLEGVFSPITEPKESPMSGHARAGKRPARSPPEIDVAELLQRRAVAQRSERVPDVGSSRLRESM